MTAIPWLDAAYTELVAGVREISGPHHNLRILEYLNSTTLGDEGGDETPWCAAFVNWCCRIARVDGTGLANARSFATWGFECSPPRLGAIVVLWRGTPTGRMGHVGFLVGRSDYSPNVCILGGNQDNRVSVAAFPASRVLAYRWPK